MASIEISVNSKGEGECQSDIGRKEWIKSYDKEGLSFCNKIGLNEKEMKKYKKGDDIYITSSRMLDLLNNIKS